MKTVQAGGNAVTGKFISHSFFKRSEDNHNRKITDNPTSNFVLIIGVNSTCFSGNPTLNGSINPTKGIISAPKTGKRATITQFK